MNNCCVLRLWVSHQHQSVLSLQPTSYHPLLSVSHSNAPVWTNPPHTHPCAISYQWGRLVQRGVLGVKGSLSPSLLPSLFFSLLFSSLLLFSLLSLLPLSSVSLLPLFSLSLLLLFFLLSLSLTHTQPLCVHVSAPQQPRGSNEFQEWTPSVGLGLASWSAAGTPTKLAGW